MHSAETGPEFETRALAVAQAIHDPLGYHGPVMHGGQERDALFLLEDQIHAYEFTTDRAKSKAEKDAQKLAGLIKDMLAKPENKFKAASGWFVTRDDPTAEQRGAVLKVAKEQRLQIHAISISTLQQRLCDSEGYIQRRDNATFGSLAYAPSVVGSDFRVDVELTSRGGTALTIDDVASSVLAGDRLLITGEFGVGKSHALREIYRAVRREHFRKKKLTPFPLHINLRESVGLRSPAEILRRHAEDIGFGNERSLISAWRAGACVLLLDGFDEIVPVRWLGGASDLKNVRWDAMSPIRRLIEESPAGTGIALCGRDHYFSSSSEMVDAIGLSSRADVLTVRDFDSEQIKQYLERAGSSWVVPDWIPGRPLLLGYLAALEGQLDASDSLERGAAWRSLLEAICQRESRMFNAVRPEVIRAIVSRVATLARSTGNETGPVDMELMRSAFVAVNNRQPDEEGLQLLLRLPGLATVGAGDSRVFADRDLADVAYGEDLAAHLANPYGDHPLKDVAAWVSATSELGVEVAADALAEGAVSAKSVYALAKNRQTGGLWDSILVDELRVALELGALEVEDSTKFSVEGVIFESFEIAAGQPFFDRLTFVDCVFQRVDLSGLERGDAVPHFQGGMIGLLDGVTGVPTWLEEHLGTVEIERFSTDTQTTAGIMSLGLGIQDRIALSILKKVYGQGGSGRKEGALVRGLELNIRSLVPGVIAEMVAKGWIQKSSAGRNVLYVAVKERRGDAHRALQTPGDFRLD